MDHGVVLGESLPPLVDCMSTKICFSNNFYFGLMLGLVDFNDIAILCYGPNNCRQPNLKSFVQPFFPQVSFHKRPPISV